MEAVKVVKDIVYEEKTGDFGKLDLYLPGGENARRF